MTTINRLYWVSRFTAHEAALSVRRRANGAAKRVHEVTTPRTGEERRHVTLTVEDYEALLDNNLAVLRGAGILQACSAFETALVGYFALGRVYAPTPLPWGYSLLGLTPAMLRTRATAAFEKAHAALVGEYTKRLGTLARRLGLAGLNPGSPTARRLDGYYSSRHRIVHGQGIVNTDVLDRCATDVAAGAVALPEPDWKRMLGDFHRIVVEIDSAVQRHVVKDEGLQLAVVSELEAKPETLGLLHYVLRSRWRLHPDRALVADHVEQAGYRLDRKGRMHAWRII